MKLSELFSKHNTNPFLKAKLKIHVTLDNGEALRKGCISDLLIDKGDGTYHFERNNVACTVNADEIKLIDA